MEAFKRAGNKEVLDWSRFQKSNMNMRQEYQSTSLGRTSASGTMETVGMKVK